MLNFGKILRYCMCLVYSSQTRNLRRSTLSYSIQMRQMMAETIVKIGAIAAKFSEEDPDSVGEP